jgi:hypothetical protein
LVSLFSFILSSLYSFIYLIHSGPKFPFLWKHNRMYRNLIFLILKYVIDKEICWIQWDPILFLTRDSDV